MSNKTIKVRDYRDPKALPELLRRAAKAACPSPKPPPHLFGSREEYRDILEHAAEELERPIPDPWAPIPKQYRGQWDFDYSEERKVFFVHCNGYGICEAEDSEVCDAICRAYNASHGHS